MNVVDSEAAVIGHRHTAQFFSAYKAVVADVAIFSIRGGRKRSTDARRSNADSTVKVMGGGRGVRIGALRVVPRSHMARASHSGSCKHGCSDQSGRQVNPGHSISPLHNSQRHVAPLRKWSSDRRIKVTICSCRSTPREAWRVVRPVRTVMQTTMVTADWVGRAALSTILKC